MSTRPEMTNHIGHKVNILGAHWSLNNIHGKGTGVSWNAYTHKWEAKIVRSLGLFDSSQEAGEALDAHINGVEEWFIQQIEMAERRLLEKNRP
jgi:hypothetical protein